MGKRTPLGILYTAGAAVGMAVNAMYTTETFYELGEKIAPRIHEYVGTIVSSAVQYGLPAIACLGTVFLAIIAVNATDKYYKR